MIEKLKELCAEVAILPLAEKVEALNMIRLSLHEISPFSAEPVDYVRWVPADSVVANEYNPNKVASPEMDLLYRSVKADGYTQPIVAFKEGNVSVVVDGFHRNHVGKTKADIKDRLHGYLPVTVIEKELHERMASTIRHNRARGKHQVDLMSELVVKLINLGRPDREIARELGMSADELIRLKQQTGIAALFKDQPFQRSWVAVDGEDPEPEERESEL